MGVRARLNNRRVSYINEGRREDMRNQAPHGYVCSSSCKEVNSDSLPGTAFQTLRAIMNSDK